MDLSERLVQSICEEFPRFRVVPKRGNALSRVIDVALKIVTLGAQREYLTLYHTVIGDTLFVPESWGQAGDIERAIVLRHERVHLRQRRRYGTLGMAFLYLVPFFPLGLAYGRARLEWEAYEETLWATAELLGLDAASALRDRIVSRFTRGAYGWMWPFRRSVERWVERALRQIEASAENAGRA